MVVDTVQKAEKLTAEIERDILQLGKLIGDCDTREEADKIWKDIAGIVPAGPEMASQIWDYAVDWKKVRWKDKI